ncbi:acyl-CoA dehydrogenase family protein [Vannielia litorea]|uniref:acyl-CoA dehydrogenase family protein n=1 Tax=Vannielia litorea TaxID=1217970 RepID=UPI001C98113A|nr:acyl-CoA dehydrogenase family protein [Vannielia litorea]MBY6049409.1 acyl-CoA dehydrogenase family protein [Vannielia litorea]MBY6076823.1 acyl-CoA dehydrogenase family protein [Vannielia litorea]
MKPFKAPLEDILFSLEAVAGAKGLPGYDPELTAEIGAHFAAFAEGELAPLDEAGDAQGARLENGRVRLPDGFVAAYKSLAEQGWQGLMAPEAYGGQEMGRPVFAVTSEIFTAANHALQMLTSLAHGAIDTILQFGTDEHKQRCIPPLASGEWLSTMALTEPGAGSDLSRIRCRAVPAGDGWKITGEKIFISGGDHDATETILHLVLARSSDDGLRGLSLFLCPSAKADGSRNAVSVTRIEEKMGIHAQPTCQLAFDGAEAELIGKEGEGLMAMFTMMNHARLDVALQGAAHAARAWDVASSYAAERVQGRGPEGEVTLDAHADVQRMIDEIDAHAVSARAMAHVALVLLESGDNPALVEFLTPLAKVWCTEAGMRATKTGMQVLGGYGYLKEYRLEQSYRDVRIAAIYEGANGIHARTLAERFVRGKYAESADAFGAWLETVSAEAGSDAVAQAARDWGEARMALAGAEDAAPLAHDFCRLCGCTMALALWAKIAAVAGESHAPERFTRLAADQTRRLAAEISMLKGLLTA